jgi:hypothetical protein
MPSIAPQAIGMNDCQGAISLHLIRKNPNSQANKPKTQVTIVWINKESYKWENAEGVLFTCPQHYNFSNLHLSLPC